MIPIRLHAKFLVFVLGSLITLLAVLSFLVVHREADLLARKSDESQHVLASSIYASLRENMMHGTPRSTVEAMNRMRGRNGVVRLETLREDGSPAFGLPRTQPGISAIEDVFRTGEEISFRERGPVPLHTALYPLKNEGECMHCHDSGKPVLGVLLISLSLQEAVHEIKTSTRDLAFFLAGLTLVTGAVLYFLVRKFVLQPLSILHDGAERIGRGDLAHRITLRTGDEIAHVAQSFNLMAGRLEESYSELENRIRERNQELNNQNRELSRNIRLIEGLLASMSSGIMLLDMNGVVELVNQAGAALFNLTPENLFKQRLTDRFPGAAVFFKSPIGPYQVTEIRLENGTTVPIGFSSTYYSSSLGEQDGIIIVYRDLTEVRTLQAEVLSKERFAAMGRVVDGVAHEFRNPLFGISSIGQIFERELENSTHRGLARALLTETGRMNRLVEELLVYGRPIKLEPEKCGIMEIWDAVVEINREELEKKGIRITNDPGIRQMTAYLDPKQIKQVFLNLLRNAIDAMPRGGDISTTLLIEDRYIGFRIIDTGEGIAARDVDRVFDLFFSTKPKGTGLGLGICRKIVEDHGGKISLESRQWDWLEEQKGTTVTIKLPFRGENSRGTKEEG